MGTDQGIYPWVSTLVMGNLMGRRFWVGRGCFCLGGQGRGRGSVRTVLMSRFSGRHVFSNSRIFYVIYYILSSGGFSGACFRSHYFLRRVLELDI
jgi:hypothetical protein